MNNLYLKYFPLKTKFISEKRLKNKWITQEVKQLINLKSEYCKKRRNGEISRAENNRLKNRINFQVKSAKNEYYKNAFTMYQKNMKKSWNTLRELLGTKKSQRNCINTER